MIDLTKSTVAVLGINQQIVGAGFFVGEQLILTCAHVVEQAGYGPGDTINIRIHANGEIRSALIDTENWAHPNENDFALLHLLGHTSIAVPPLSLGFAEPCTGHPLRVLGYPKLGGFLGIWASGEIKGLVIDAAGKNMLQLESIDIAMGSSGGAVLDLYTEKVVGMISLAYDPGPELHHIGAAFATPTEILLQICPQLAEQPQPPIHNPFFASGAVPPELFVGRRSALQLLQFRLGGGHSLQSVSIVGERRMGKSSLLHYACQRPTELFPGINPLMIYMNLMKGYCHTRKGFTKALRIFIKEKLGSEPWTAEDDEDLEALSFAFEKLSDDGVKLILCLDEIENLTKRKAEFDELLEELRAASQISQIGIITASERPLADLCANGGLISPFYNIFMQDTLRLFEVMEWHSLIRKQMMVSDEELASIEWLAGGHPFYTQICAARLWEAHHSDSPIDWVQQSQGDVEPHWTGWWTSLADVERSALRALVGLPVPKPQDQMLEKLTRRGLLRADKLFSVAFGEWVRDQG